MSLKEVAKGLEDDATEEELKSRVLQKLKELQLPKNGPVATRFYDKPEFADCKIRVTLASDDGGDGSGEEGQSLELGGPADFGKRRRSPNEVEPDAKRVRGVMPRAGVHVLQVHGIVLALRSPFFEKALTGGWKEQDEKAIDIQLPSLEAFEDFRLLLKLSYGSSFIMDDGERVPRDVMLRLLVLSNQFEMLAAMYEIAEALKEGLTYKEAVEVCRVVPEEIHGHGAVEALLDHAGDVIAESLGPVHELWGPRVYWHGDFDHYDDFPIAAKAKELPLNALERTLRSPKLQVVQRTKRIVSWRPGCTRKKARAKKSGSRRGIN